MTTTNIREGMRKRVQELLDELYAKGRQLDRLMDEMIELVPAQRPGSTVEGLLARVIDGTRELQAGSRYVSNVALFGAAPEVIAYALDHGGEWQQYGAGAVTKGETDGVVQFMYDDTTITIHHMQRDDTLTAAQMIAEMGLAGERVSAPPEAIPNGWTENLVDGVPNGQGHRTRSAEEAIEREQVDVPSSFAAECKGELL